MNLESVHQNDISDFRQMVEVYWQEIMSHSDIVKSHESREAYFQERFPFEDDDLRLFWGGVELIECNVRRDNPQALAFWEAQGFRIALYRLRQYRDPKRGTSYVGALSSDFT